MTLSPVQTVPAPPGPGKNAMSVAQALEATFLSQMLESAGLGRTSELFGGGLGEDQFSSFARDIQAKQMVSAGGIGLAQTIFESLKVRADDQP